MLFALLILLTSIQMQSPKTEPAQPVAAPTVTANAAPPAFVPAPEPSAATEEAAPPDAEPEPEAEPELPTRQVCRYVAVTGQRFPVRTCRTVTIEPAESN